LKRLKATPIPIIIAASSVFVGVLLSLLIIGQQTPTGLNGNPDDRFTVDASFRDEVLIVHVRNLTGEEVEVSTVYLVGQNYMDYEMLVDEKVKPRGELEIETNIRQPKQHGTYKVRVSLSNGLTIECEVEVP